MNDRIRETRHNNDNPDEIRFEMGGDSSIIINHNFLGKEKEAETLIKRRKK